MIYFIQGKTSGLIKIGTTVRLSERLKTLRAEYVDELQLLAVMDGRFDEETALHRRFSHLCVENEWFAPSSELMDFITSKGRPWAGEDESCTYGAIKLDDELFKPLKRMALESNTTMSELLSDIINEELGRRKGMVGGVIKRRLASPRGPKPRRCSP